MLIVNPHERLTAEEALDHPFFGQVQDTFRYFAKPFAAKRKFRVSFMHCVVLNLIIIEFRSQFVDRNCIFVDFYQTNVL